MNFGTGNLHWIDLTILVVYLIALAGVGSYFSRSQENLKDFVRGAGKAGWLTLGLSLMAALNSGIDYVKAPALIFNVGMTYTMLSVSWILLYPWFTKVTLPFYKRLDVYSAYEYLEMRFGLAVRLLAA